ncbi:MAG: MobA/MobL family protein [Nitrososphaerota archaeon]|nr:MobA/MobL family protein [Nitrososphaerota archaeon]
MDVKVIGRSSGRSAVGASAYRSGEKLRSNVVKSAAYGSGSKLRDGEIVHDYTKKKGVVHSEILLPKGAPSEYADRETLWNAVERTEKRKDAQLAREIILALPREFTLEEHIEVMRQYIQENFVSKGMIADFAIHNEGNANLNLPAEGAASGARNQTPEFAATTAANPHAHIMLTMRNVSPDGFGLKNTDWNKKTILLSYREAWTHIINNTLASKGLDMRIDHRTLKEQGIDREPMIHIGHKAAALERLGIRTDRGNYNREITRRNEERILLKEAIYMEIQELRQLRQTLDYILESAENSAKVEVLPTEVITKLKTINRMNETPQNVTASENRPTTPTKAFTEKKVSEKNNIIKTVKQRKILLQQQLTVRNEQQTLEAVRDEHVRERSMLNFFHEVMLEKAKDAKTLHSRAARLKAKGRRWRFLLSRKSKAELDQAIEQAEGDLRIALYYFKDVYKIELKDVFEESNRMKAQIGHLDSEIEKQNVKISELSGELLAIKQDYAKYRFRVKKREQPIGLPEFDLMGRRSTPALMQSLRRQAEDERRRRMEKKRIREARPKKMRVVALDDGPARPRPIGHNR